MTDDYELYYWPFLPGRGEIIRMILEDAGVPYRDVAREQGAKAVVSARTGSLGGVRPFAPPILKHGELVLSQSSVVARYLAERHGLVPENASDRLLAEQHFLGWSDLMAETHDTHHPLALGLSYEDQMDAAKQRARHFLADRLSKWLQHFEHVVEAGGGVHVPAGITYPDLMARFVLRGIEYAFPKAFAAQRDAIPGLIALMEQVETRPKLATYFASERAMPFNEHGIFRRYPELDAS